MKKSKILILLLAMVMILCVSAVGAADLENTSDSAVQAVDDNDADAIASDDVDTQSATDDSEVLTDTDGNNFTSLQTRIDTETGNIYIDGKTYTRAEGENTLVINKTVNIVVSSGTGIIDANNKGGIFNITSSGALTLTGVTLVNGNSENGGAVYNEGEFVAGTTTFKNNTATNSGGAIYNNGKAVITSSIFTGNSAGTGQSIYSEGNLSLTGNTINGPIVSTGNGLITSTINVTVLDNEVKTVNTDNPVVNATITDDNGNIINQSGTNTFKFTADKEYEAVYNDSLGYYQATCTLPGSGIYTVNVTYAAGTLNITSKDKNLRNTKGTYTDLNNTIAAAVAATSKKVTVNLNYNYTYDANFDSGFNNGIIIPTKCSHLTINGNGYTISGNNAKRIFYSSLFSGEAIELVLNNITLANANDGAVYLKFNNLYANNVNFINNTIYGNGGAVYLIDEAWAFFTDCNFVNNSAVSGGAVYVDDEGYAEFTNCNFTNNTASSYGAAIYTGLPDNNYHDELSAIINNSIFSGNSGIGTIYNVGQIQLNGNTINTTYAEIYNVGNITSKVYTSVFNNGTVYVDDPTNVIINATVYDDNGNLIYDPHFEYFTVSDNVGDVVVTPGYEVYTGTVTLPKKGYYTVSMTNSQYDVTVKTGVIAYVIGSFTDLQVKINDAIENNNGVLDLPYDFKYNSTLDKDLYYITINGNLTINGNSKIINGTDLSSIFFVNATTVLDDIVFTGAKEYAIFNNASLTVSNSNFTENYLAIYNNGTLTLSGNEISKTDALIYDDGVITELIVNVTVDGASKYVYYVGENVVLNATITDADGNLIKESNVKFILTNGNYTENVTATYSEANKYTATIDPVKDYDYTVTLQYVDDANVTYTTTSASLITEIGTFTDLQRKIDNGTNFEFEYNFTYNADIDSVDYIVINNAITIDGKGFTISGAGANKNYTIFVNNTASLNNIVFEDVSGYAIYNNGTLTLQNNTISTTKAQIYNNAVITNMGAIVLENETIYDAEIGDYVSLYAFLVDDNDNLIQNKTSIKLTVSYGTTVEELETYYKRSEYKYLLTDDYLIEHASNYTISVDGISDVKTTVYVVPKADINVTIALNDTITRKENETITIILYGGSTIPLSKSLTVYIDSTVSGTKSYQGVSGDDGVYTLTIVYDRSKNILVPGNYTVGIIISSDDDYNQYLNLSAAKFEVQELDISHSFAGLQKLIDEEEVNGTLVLPYDFTYDSYIDSEFDLEEGVLISKNITIDGNGYTLNATQVCRIFNITEGVTVTLKNLTITEGDAEFAGAIYVGEGASLTVTDTTFINNTAHYGGAIYVDAGASLTVTNTTFRNNTADYTHGGAIYINGAAFDISDSKFINNNVDFEDGGAIYISESDGTVSDCEFTSNNADYGGAISVVRSNVTVSGCDFISNNAGYGGAIIAYGDGVNLTIISSTFYNNTCKYDGNAVLIWGTAFVSIDSSYFFDNGNLTGYAIYNEGTLALYNNIVDNIIYNVGTITTPVTATILGNYTYDITEDTYILTATLEDDFYNYIYDPSLKFIVNGVEVSDIYYNATTKEYNATYTLTGERLYLLSVKSNYTYDNLTVKTSILRNITGTYTDLNNTIAKAVAEGVDVELEYDFAYDDVIDASFTQGIEILDSITINGNGYTISGSYSNRIFYINASKVEINNVTLSDGYAASGGALLVSSDASDLTLDNVTFTNNNVAFVGGAILWYGDNGYIKNSLFEDNYAGYVGGAILSVGKDLLVLTCEFANNTAYYGGAIGFGANATVGNSVFCENFAYNYGGAIYIADAYVSIYSSNFTDNSADVADSIYLASGSLYLSENNVTSGKTEIVSNGTIVSDINIVVLEGQNWITNSYEVKLNATIVDDNGNFIEDAGFNFTIAGNSSIQAVYDDATQTYNAEYTLSAPGVYPVSMTYVVDDNLIVDSYNITCTKGTYTDLYDNFITTGKDLTYDFKYDADIDGEKYINGIVIDSDFTIYGNGYTISGDNLARIFNITNGNLILYNVTLTKGNASRGGAVYVCEDAEFDARYVNFTDNTAVYYGGAIFSDGYVYVLHSVFINNSAVSGGAIDIYSYDWSNYVYISDSNFTDNVASLTGAAVCVYTEGIGKSYVEIYNSEFDGNNAQAVSIEVYEGSKTGIFISGSKFSNSDGYAIKNSGASLSLDNNTVDTVIYNKGTIETEINATFIDNQTITDKNIYDVVTLNATLTDDVGNAIYDPRFKISVNGVNVDTSYSNTTKLYTASYTLHAGTTVISTEYTSTDLNVFEGRYIIDKVNVTDFSLYLEDLNDKLPYGSNATIIAYLEGVNGTLLNETFNIVVNNTPYSITVVNGVGQVNVSGLAPGQYSALGIFPGNDDYNAAYATVMFVIAYPDAVLDIVADDILYGEDAVINITLTDAEGNPLAGYVKVDVAGYTFYQYVDGNETITVTGLSINTAGYLVNATFEGDDLYFPAVNDTVYIKVFVSGSSVTIDPVENVTYGSTVVVYYGIDNRTDNVTITIVDLNDTSKVISFVDTTSSVVIAGLDAGNYSITVYNNDDDYYKGSSDTAYFTVFEASSSVTIDPIVNVTYGSSVEVYYTIENETSFVTISVVDLNDPEKVIEYISAVSEVIIAGLDAGNYSITIHNGADGNYMESNATAYFSVLEASSSVTIDSVENVTYGSSVEVYYTIENETSFVTITVVDLNDPEKVIEYIDTTLKVIIADLPVGNYSITIHNGADGNYMESNATAYFSVLEASSSVTIDSVENVTYGESVEVYYTIENETSFVTISVVDLDDPEKVIEYISAVSEVIIAGLDAGDYSITIYNGGDGNYKESSATAYFTVNKAGSNVTIDAIDNVTYGDSVVIHYTIENETDNVVILVVGEDGTLYSYNVSYRTVTVSGLPAGEFVIYISNGDDNYETSVGTATFYVLPQVIDPDDVEVTFSGEYDYGLNITITAPVDGNYSVNIVGKNSTTVYVEVVNGTGSIVYYILAAGDYVANTTITDPNYYLENVQSVVSYKEYPVLNVTITGTYPDGVITISGPVGNYYVYIDGFDTFNVTIVGESVEGTGSASIENIAAGNYSANIVFYSDGYWDDVNETHYFTIDKADVTITPVVVGDAVVDNPLNITFTLPTDITGNVYAYIDGVAVTDLTVNETTGVYTVVFDAGFLYGDHYFTVDLLDDKNYNYATETLIFAVDKVDPTGIVNITYTVPTNTTTVIFNITGPVDATGFLLVDINGESYYVDVVNGTGNITVSGFIAGNYTANVSYSGDDKYDVLNTTTTVEIPSNLADSSIVIPSTATTYNPTFSVNLPSDATGYITVVVDGTKYYAAVSNGKASVSVPGLSEGNHNVTVTYYSGDDKYTSISKSSSVTLTTPVTKLKGIYVKALYSATAYYKVLLTIDGNAIAGKKITFTYMGKTYSAKTDSKGYATIKINTKVAPNKYKTKYIVTAKYGSVSTKNKVKIKNIIKAKNKKVKKSKAVTKIKIKLKKVDGKYVANAKLKIKFKGKTYKVKTNAKGKAKWKVKSSMIAKLKVGKKYKYKVTYGKDIVTKKLKIKK